MNSEYRAYILQRFKNYSEPIAMLWKYGAASFEGFYDYFTVKGAEIPYILLDDSGVCSFGTFEYRNSQHYEIYWKYPRIPLLKNN